jgi:hypothetical protein
MLNIGFIRAVEYIKNTSLFSWVKVPPTLIIGTKTFISYILFI